MIDALPTLFASSLIYKGVHNERSSSVAGCRWMGGWEVRRRETTLYAMQAKGCGVVKGLPVSVLMSQLSLYRCIYFAGYQSGALQRLVV